ncbi:MAG: MaoC family dehydratase N-terminal domain-containing protein [Actinomycetales bacterium]
MSVNEDFVGKVYPPEGIYEVSREKIREFALATCGEELAHPAYLDPAVAASLGHADVLAPPTFLVIPAQRSDERLIADPDAGIDFSRVVHGEESFTHHRAVVAGDRLQATLHVDAIRMAAGNAIITTRNEITDEAGHPVSTVVSTLVVRGERS